jgi:hypothetical protein
MSSRGGAATGSRTGGTERARAARRHRPVLAVYVITIFLSAWLLFLVQPMVAKMVLPLLGGTPAVWNTAMMFFQFMLLAGYLYAHLGTRWLGVKRQAWLHVGIMLPAALVLPIAIGEGWVPPATTNPVGWLLIVLLVAVGLPFFVVSASAPLLQRWFSTTGHHAAGDPYFLYAASNAGSMIALLSYPLVIEMWLDLPRQSEVWSFGYVVLIVLMVVCVVGMGVRGVVDGSDLNRGTRAKPRAAGPLVVRAIGPGRLARWVMLAFVPSSLMLGVTTYITTDLVVVPLLWVIPLAIYLLTFILVFARRQVVSLTLMRRLLPIAVIVLLMMLVSEATEPLGVIAIAHLAAFFIMAMVCHGELARDRPPAGQLTTFYLMMAIGGLFGGVFNAIIAPAMFTSIAEYPVAIVAACLLAPALVMVKGKGTSEGQIKLEREAFSLKRDGLPAAFVCVVMVGLLWIVDVQGLAPGPMRLALLGGLPAVVCFLLSKRMMRFGLAIGAVFLVSSFDTAHRGDVLEADRTFFGVHRVTQVKVDRDDDTIAYHMLYHGTTLHGQQRVDPVTNEPIEPHEPLAYYHRTSPVGQLFDAMQQAGRASEVGLIGLGVGALAAYAGEGDRYTYFEIDPTVERMAEETRYFTYLAAARERGAMIQTVLGDARLTLARADDARFDILVGDAFSSDSIPVHLLTREAIELYMSRLRNGGVLIIHISNRYLNLEPIVANIAVDLGLVCYVQHDTFLDEREVLETGKQNSSWAVIAREVSDLRPLLSHPAGARWREAEGDPSMRTWTDRYTNILRVMMW